MLDALRRIVGYWLEILAFAQLRMGGKFQAAFLPEKASMRRQEIVIDLPVASTSKFWSSPIQQKQTVMGFLAG
ncbi:hypothetical protein WJX72_005187 [[Myrmecia] bisecta]|uniref:Uncharacterized protein n=1 Tax=[Myrmecia] bisecta TaxID=41462 RepID=A0AAW1R5Q1_9CHLO